MRVTEPDPRPAHQRRLDALVEIVGRGVAAPDGQQTTDKAKIVVTIDYDTLAGKLADSGPPTPMGSRPPREHRRRHGRRHRHRHPHAGLAPMPSPPARQRRAALGTGCGVSGTGDRPPAGHRAPAAPATRSRSSRAVLGATGRSRSTSARHRRLVTPRDPHALVLRDHAAAASPGAPCPQPGPMPTTVTHWIDGGTDQHAATSPCSAAADHTYVHRHGLTDDRHRRPGSRGTRGNNGDAAATPAAGPPIQRAGDIRRPPRPTHRAVPATRETTR